jgi:HEPN domain-containing protein
MSLKYVSRQDKWIKDGLTNIIGIDASRKTLARSFLNFGKIDLDAYKLLKENSPSLAIFHLQQAAEKVAKAMLVLDMNDMKYEDLKKHDFIYLLETLIRKNDEKMNIDTAENVIFRQALTYSSPKFLDFLKPKGIENRHIYSKKLEEDIKLHNKIIELKEKAKSDNIGENERSELKKLIEKKEREFLDSGLLTTMMKGRAKDKILSSSNEEIKSFIFRDKNEPSLYVFSPESRKILLPFFNILFVTDITYPHEAYSRYPNTDGLIKDYSDTGIFKASDAISERLHDIVNGFEELNFL